MGRDEKQQSVLLSDDADGTVRRLGTPLDTAVVMGYDRAVREGINGDIPDEELINLGPEGNPLTGECIGDCEDSDIEQLHRYMEMTIEEDAADVALIEDVLEFEEQNEPPTFVRKKIKDAQEKGLDLETVMLGDGMSRSDMREMLLDSDKYPDMMDRTTARSYLNELAGTYHRFTEDEPASPPITETLDKTPRHPDRSYSREAVHYVFDSLVTATFPPGDMRQYCIAAAPDELDLKGARGLLRQVLKLENGGKTSAWIESCVDEMSRNLGWNSVTYQKSLVVQWMDRYDRPATKSRQ